MNEGTIGTWRRGGINTQADLDTYNARVADILGLNKARWLAYEPGEATEQQWADLGVTASQRARAEQEDRETSARKAAANLSSNQLALAFLTAAVGGSLLGPGAGAGTEGAGSGLLSGSASPWAPIDLMPEVALESLPSVELPTLEDLAFEGHFPATVSSTVPPGGGPSLLDNPVTRNALSKLATNAVGALSGGNQPQTGTTTTTKEPWGPAQEWIRQNIDNGQKLQTWYQQSPFNAQQKAGMQNTLSNADNYRANVLPGLLDFANQMQGGQYQRQRGGAPGSGAGYGGAVVPGGYTPGTGHTFSAAPGQSFGLIDWDGINPYNQPQRTS